MDLALKVAEKLLFTIVSSVVLFIAGFSVMTGKFPPSTSDFKTVVSSMKQMYFANEEYLQHSKNFESLEPSLDQMLQLQKLSVQRTEAAVKLSKIMARFPKGVPSEKLAEKIDKIAFQIDQAGIELEAVQLEIQATMAAKGQQ